MSLIQGASQPQKGSISDVGDAILSAYGTGGGTKAIDDSLKSSMGARQAQADRQVSAQGNILSLMKELRSQGDPDVEAVDKAVSRFAGDDPVKYQRLLEALHNDPEPVTRMNAVTKAAIAAGKLGIQKSDYQVLGYGSRLVDKNSGNVVVSDNVDPSMGYGKSKAPSGYQFSMGENGEKTLMPIPGGPADPSTRNSSIKPPSGYQITRDDSGNIALTAIPGGPADRLSPEASAKRELLVTGIQDMQDYKKLLFNPNGSVRRRNLVNAAAGVPFTDGRTARSLIMNAVEAKLRAESGAAVPEQEVQRMADRFVPQLGDNEGTIKSKTARLEQFLSGTIESVDATSSRKYKVAPAIGDQDKVNALVQKALDAGYSQDEITKYIGRLQ